MITDLSIQVLRLPRTRADEELPRIISIVYRRLPDNVREFPGLLRYATSRSLIIETRLAPLKPVRVSGRVIVDVGYLAVWFILKDKWYDVGKFYDRSGNWLGYYCDIIKPVSKLLENHSRTVEMTDLCLDLWIDTEKKFVVLDEEEFQACLKKQYITIDTARRAREQLNSLIRMVQAHSFPPRAVRAIEPTETSALYDS